MEWEELKVGQVIRWNFTRALESNPIIILIEEVRNVNEFGCTVLSGTCYPEFYYRELLLPSQTMMGFVGLRKDRFNKHKGEVVPASDGDEPYIDARLNRHVQSYYSEYLRQKGWADALKSRADKYFQNRKGKSNATNKTDTTKGN